MLPAAQRLRSGREIATVSRRGTRASHGDLVSTAMVNAPRVSAHQAAPAAPAGVARATVVVGKRAGNAVARNRLKRRVRHALAPTLSTAPAGAALVLRAGPASHALSTNELHAAVRDTTSTALRRAARRAAGSTGQRT